MRPAHRRLEEATRTALQRMTDDALAALIQTSPEGFEWWESLTDHQLAALAAGRIPKGLPTVTDEGLPR